MTGSSLLVYNGVSLPYVKTEKFTQEIIYSPDGVDSMYTKITIGVGCVLSPCLFNGTDVADWVRNVKPYLMVRGAQLYFTMDGDYVLQPNIPSENTYAFDCAYNPDGYEAIDSPNFTAAGGQRFSAVSDAKLGPKPLRFDVRRIEGNTWLAYYEIETYIPYCNAGSTPPYYLSNRWTTTINVDDEYFMSRTIDGILILNGQYGNQTKYWSGPENFPVDAIVEDMVTNAVIIPPCPKRWERETIDIVRSSDGLTINYRIVDKQLYTAMPRPATKIDAQYSETTGTKDFALMNMMVCEIQCTVTGEANANWNPTGTISGGGGVSWNANGGVDYNKYNLMTLMFQIVLSRIPFPFLLSDAQANTNIGDNNKYIIQYFQMKEDVFKPIVGCTVRALRPRLFNSQTIGHNLATPSQGIYSLTNIGSTILVADCINDIARQPENMLNWGAFLIAAQSLNTGFPGVGSLTPCQLASAILYPCADTMRNINTSIASSNTAVGSTSITVTNMNYAAIGATNTTPSQSQLAITNTGKYYSAEQYKNPFTEYTIDIQYLTDQHMFQLPVMYDLYPIQGTVASGCVFAQTSAPTTRKIVHWKASRIGQWPMSPQPSEIVNCYGPSYNDNNPTNDQLLSYHLTFSDSFLMQDGVSRKYETAGVYEAGMAIRLQWDQPGAIPTAVNPITSDVWETTIASTSIGSASMYPTSLFVSGIIGYSTESPGGGQPS